MTKKRSFVPPPAEAEAAVPMESHVLEGGSLEQRYAAALEALRALKQATPRDADAIYAQKLAIQALDAQIAAPRAQ